MITETDILESTQKFVQQQLPLYVQDNADAKDLQHTIALVAVAEKVGKAVKLGDEDMQTLLLAAWLHDLRLDEIAEIPTTNNVITVAEYLDSIGLKPADIEKVNHCIVSAQYPQHPQ